MRDLYLHRPFQHPELHPAPVEISLSKRERSANYDAARKDLSMRYGEVLGTFLAKRLAAQARKLKLKSHWLWSYQVAEVRTSEQQARKEVLGGRFGHFGAVHWGPVLTYREPDGAVREFVFAFLEPD